MICAIALSVTCRLALRAFLLLDSEDDDSSDSEASDDEEEGDEELLLICLLASKRLKLRFDRGWTARGGMYIVALNQIPDDSHFQRRMFRFEKNDIERLMGLIDWPAVGQFRGPQRHVYHPLECLLACMRKLSQPINLFDLLGKPPSSASCAEIDQKLAEAYAERANE